MLLCHQTGREEDVTPQDWERLIFTEEELRRLSDIVLHFAYGVPLPSARRTDVRWYDSVEQLLEAAK